MVNSTTVSQRNQLEKQWIQHTKKYSFISRIPALFYSLIQSLTTGNQPRVWQVQQNGISCWNAYDPVSDCRAEGLSESEMRVWLEERYNQ